jgi:hypothetical protein
VTLLLTRKDKLMPYETTPPAITAKIRKFAQELSPGQEPVFVQVEPKPGAKKNECHLNVERFAKDNGGSPVYGWTIWQSPIYLDAEFHAVWRDERDVLLDITPKADGERRILFVPDPARRWEGICVASRHYPLSDTSAVRDLLEVAHEMGTIQEKYRPDEFFSQDDAHRFLALKAKREQLFLRAHGKHPVEPVLPSEGRVGRNETCPCGSGKKFKKCCLRQATGE